MGIIQRQAIKSNLIAIISTLVGLIAMVEVYPRALDAKGLADAMYNWATIIFPFMTLGAGLVMVKLVPSVRAPAAKAKAQLFSWSLVAVTATLTVVGLILWLTYRHLLSGLAAWGVELTIVSEYPLAIFIILSCLTLNYVANNNLVNHNRIAVPAVFNSLLIKVIQPLLVLAVYAEYVSLGEFAYGVSGMYALAALGIFAYSWYIGALRLDFSRIELHGYGKRAVASIAAFSVFGTLGSSLVTGADIVLVANLLGTEATAIYGFGLFAAMLMYLPLRSINSISAPLIVDSWSKKNIEHLSFLYQESSLVLTTIAGVMTLGMFFCLPPVYEITDNLAKYEPGYWSAVFLALGIGFDLITSLNSVIINYSDLYRWNILFVLLSGVINLTCSYVFIAYYDLGLAGAGLGSTVALFVYNAVKVNFLYRRVGILPFRWGHLYLFGLFLIIFALVWVLPDLASPILDVLLRGGVIVVATFLALAFTDIVPPVRKLITERGRGVF